jgi:PAS domain S-box-containing protein
MSDSLPEADRTVEALRQRLGADAVLQALPIGICCCDAQGIIREFNRRAAAIWGIEPRIGDPYRRFSGAVRLFRADGQPLPHDQTPMAEVLATGKAAHDRQVIFERPDGSRVTALVNVEPLLDHEGRLVGAVNCFQDISVAVAAESRFAASERIFRAILEALPAAVYTTDAKGRITYYNQAAVELAGREPKIGSDQWCVTWKLYWPDGTPLPHDECPMAMALKERRPIRGMEAIAERPDGSRIRFAPYPSPLFDDSGSLVGAVNMLVDVTHRHDAEAHLGAIVASSDDAIVSKDLTGRVKTWNAGAVRIFGYPPEEMIGQPILKIIPPEMHHDEDEILARIRRGERIEHFETVRVAKDGRRLDISLTVSPVHDAVGRVVGASKVARDITEAKRTQALQQLLVGELNHRVKNTLATVQAMATQTLRRAASPAEFATGFSGRLQSLARAHDLLTQSSWAGADLQTLAHDQLVLGGAESSRITFSGPQVNLDAQPALHVAMILHELGTNARKHGALSVAAGRVSLNWEVRTHGDRQLLLHWEERGGPPVSVPTQHGFGTMLIGRSLAAHGGRAELHYRAEGVACEIALPLAERTSAMAPQHPGGNTPISSATPASLRGCRILVIEDEALIALDVAATFEDAGCTVIGPAANLEQARSLIASQSFDVALLDANLAGQPVDELAAALTRRQIRFAFLSGYGPDALPIAYRTAPLIRKPFVASQAIKVVSQLLDADRRVVRLRSKSPDSA